MSQSKFDGFWGIASARAARLAMTGVMLLAIARVPCFAENPAPTFQLSDPGEEVIDYSKYGEFQGLGTGGYKYKASDRKGLMEAAGEGVYPSTAIYKDPSYKELLKAGKLEGLHWNFSNIDDLQCSFYKWATAPETPAVQQYFTARALEKAGHLKQAIKAYHAVAVHFPKQTGWTVFKTPIYYPQRAMDKVEYLTRIHPELGWKYVDYEFVVKNGDNAETGDDLYESINPGKIIVIPAQAGIKGSDPRLREDDKGREDDNGREDDKTDISKLKITKSVGGDHVKLVQFESGHWQMQVDGKPFMVKAIAYEPTPVGQSAHDGSRGDWMQADLNKNGKADGPYDTWIDANKNNIQDPDEPVVGDFELLKRMGVNAFRHYHGASNQELLREAYEKYGIMSIVGDLMGMYAAGSAAEWYEGTDFTSEQHRKNMEESIRGIVLKHKDEPYLLMWVLSNEGNYGIVGDPTKPTLGERVGLGSRGKEQHEAMYQFANDMAKMIKQLDPNHPVAFSNGETMFVQSFGRLTPDIDIFGVNTYRGKDGFGASFWGDIKRYTDKPVFITEFGCPAYHERRTLDESEDLQAEYLKGNWEDIMHNRAGSGVGNSIGGSLFQFIDEWWKAGPAPEFDPKKQETTGDFQAEFPDGWMHEEWLGVTSQGDGSQSPYSRQLRKSFYYFEEAWNKG